jgi:hypothetical protein
MSETSDKLFWEIWKNKNKNKKTVPIVCLCIELEK